MITLTAIFPVSGLSNGRLTVEYSERQLSDRLKRGGLQVCGDIRRIETPVGSICLRPEHGLVVILTAATGAVEVGLAAAVTAAATAYFGTRTVYKGIVKSRQTELRGLIARLAEETRLSIAEPSESEASGPPRR